MRGSIQISSRDWSRAALPLPASHGPGCFPNGCPLDTFRSSPVQLETGEVEGVAFFLRSITAWDCRGVGMSNEQYVHPDADMEGFVRELMENLSNSVTPMPP